MVEMGKLRPLHWPYGISGGGASRPQISCFEDVGMELAARSSLKPWDEGLKVWQTPALPLTTCAALGESLHLSEPQFSPSQNMDSASNYLRNVERIKFKKNTGEALSTVLEHSGCSVKEVITLLSAYHRTSDQEG